MNGIGKIDATGALAAFSYPDAHPVMALWTDDTHGFLRRLHSTMRERQMHPARTLVLLPYAQLRPLAARLWARKFGDGFAPRFETTKNWTHAASAHQAAAIDIRMDATWDSLTAQSLLAEAGLAEQQNLLAGLLVQTAHLLAPLAAARAPESRTGWAQQASQAATAGMAAGALDWELAVARIAVQWVAHSGYPGDCLFDPSRCPDVDGLIWVQGISADPMASGVAAVWQTRSAELALQSEAHAQQQRSHPVQWHACQDAEDEAQRCAAQALAHIAKGTFPVALVSSDRALTRRVRALLDGAGVAIRDENGWKLSTSHAAAGVMALLQACAWNASSDQVLAWLKACAAEFLPERDALEAALRRAQVRDWRHVPHTASIQDNPQLLEAVRNVDALRSSGKGSHTLAHWLGWLRTALMRSGQWQTLQADPAGAQLLDTLGLQTGPDRDALLAESLWSQRRWDLAGFSRWLGESLEAASFKPPYPQTEQLVILPMSQMLGRPFAAVLMAGCDEVRLMASPEPPGPWTAAQREALELPCREALQAGQERAWQSALQTPVCDVFWRTSDEGGEPLLPSPLVQLLQLSAGATQEAADPRQPTAIAARPTHAPQPQAATLPVAYLTQGAYDDLRTCPYRFFALRQLGLQPVEELEAEVDKRDFGVWLHAVLQRFHSALATQVDAPLALRQTLMDQASRATTASMQLAEGEFLPFAASWPAVSASYLNWLQDHEASEQARYARSEADHVQRLGSLEIRGRIDRIDSVPGGRVMLLDYKTESSDKTRARIKDPLEDTQMAFYAALLPDDTLRAAYVNISEKKTATLEQAGVVAARDALIEGMLTDVQRIADGAALPALGQGSSCDYCKARGLCRKDFWVNA